MKFLVFPFGSAGDVHPFIGLALALQKRGHAVTLITNGHFRPLVERTGLEFVQLGTEQHYLEITEHPDLWHPARSFGFLFRNWAAYAIREQYKLIEAELAVSKSSDSVAVISNLFGMGALLAQEKLGVPAVTVHLQPSCLWSEYASPTMAGMINGPRVPRWFKRFQFRMGETFFIDRPACPELNRFRAELGLPPVNKITRWWHSPRGVVGLFPNWFAPPQPDRPENVVLTSFPMWDAREFTELDPAVDAFIERHGPPLVFTPGSGNKQAAAFFAAAVDACQRLNQPGMLLTPFLDQLPDRLPQSIVQFGYVPLSILLPRAAAIVHHGGIGTTAQGFRAGIPQLLMPMAHDQPDNAARVKRLGVGDWLDPHRFQGPSVARKLDKLLSSPEVRANCLEVRGRFDDNDPFQVACRAIEQMVAPSRRRFSSDNLAKTRA